MKELTKTQKIYILQLIEKRLKKLTSKETIYNKNKFEFKELAEAYETINKDFWE